MDSPDTAPTVDSPRSGDALAGDALAGDALAGGALAGGAQPVGIAPPSADMAAEAQQALAALTGRPDAVFHPGQLEAISALVEHRQRALVVQRTGWG
ncbi:MAG: hypothetical protein V4755_17005, partial [Curtobacterium sp.]